MTRFNWRCQNHGTNQLTMTPLATNVAVGNDRWHSVYGTRGRLGQKWTRPPCKYGASISIIECLWNLCFLSMSSICYKTVHLECFGQRSTRIWIFSEMYLLNDDLFLLCIYSLKSFFCLISNTFQICFWINLCSLRHQK